MARGARLAGWTLAGASAILAASCLVGFASLVGRPSHETMWATLFLGVGLIASGTLALLSWVAFSLSASPRRVRSRRRVAAGAVAAAWLAGGVTHLAVRTLSDGKATLADVGADAVEAFVGGPVWWTVFRTDVLAILVAAIAATVVLQVARRRGSVGADADVRS